MGRQRGQGHQVQSRGGRGVRHGRGQRAARRGYRDFTRTAEYDGGVLSGDGNTGEGKVVRGVLCNHHTTAVDTHEERLEK